MTAHGAAPACGSGSCVGRGQTPGEKVLSPVAKLNHRLRIQQLHPMMLHPTTHATRPHRNERVGLDRRASLNLDCQPLR